MAGSKTHVAEYAITDIASAIKILKVLGRHDPKKNVYYVSDKKFLDLLTKDARDKLRPGRRCTGNYASWILVQLGDDPPCYFAVIGTLL